MSETCLHCGQPVLQELKWWTQDAYSVEGCPTIMDGGKPKQSAFHKSCLPQFLAARSRFFDDVDEVMNANAHFERTDGMSGIYRDGEFEHEVSAYWQRADVEGTHLFPTMKEPELLNRFRQALQKAGLPYRYRNRKSATIAP